MKKCVISFLICLFAVTANGNTIYVDANGTGDYPTIQAAIDAATNGDVIILMPGTYTGSGNKNISYLGKAITVRSTYPYEQSVVDSTIIDGQDYGNIGFIFNSGEGPDSVLSGLTITHCGADYGGGILSSGSPTVSSCKFINNSAGFEGGGIINSGNMIIIGCNFINNWGGMTYGGGILNSGNINVINSIFIDNFYNALINSSASGTVNITNCLFIGNGLENSNMNSVNVTNCTFSGTNFGISSYYTIVNVKNCILWDIEGDPVSGTGFSVSYSCIKDGYTGTGNIDSDPFFVTGPRGDYYLSQIAAGQAIDSPCVDAGSDSASNLSMDELTTRTDEVNDSGTVDMGYHYGESNFPVIYVSPVNLQFEANHNGPNPASQTITIRNAGEVPINWTASIDANWLSIDVNSGTCTNYYDTNTITVSVDINGIAAGTYYAHIVVSDPCALNSPQTVTVKLRVIGPIIKLSKSTFYFTALESDVNPANQVLGISNIGSNVLNWQISETCNWLKVAPKKGSSTSEVDNVNIIVHISGLAAGIYNCRLTVSSDDAENSPRTVNVQLRVIGPIIELSENAFYFEAPEGGDNPAIQVLGISNIGGAILNWQIAESCDWLSVEPNWGSSTSEVDDVNIIIDISGLAAGIYNCQLTVSSDYAENSPQVVTVTCSVYSVSTMLYWTDSGADKIQRARLFSLNIEDVVTTGLQEPQNIAFDLSEGKMYWTDSGTNKIQRANPDGSNIEDVVTGLSEPWGIALYRAAGKIYWSEYGTNRIQRASLDGSNIEELITGLTSSPSGIALDLSGGKMYWGSQILCRANLDGSNYEELYQAGMGWISSVALDLVSGKVYWAGTGICRSNLDGSNVEYLVNTWSYSITLDLPNSKMYWTDDYTGKIRRANLNGSNVEDMVTGLSSPCGIVIAENIVTDDLSVTPFDGLKSEGYEGGPFTPESVSYTLRNTGPNSIDWTASATQSWLDVSPSSGTLGSNDVDTVQININSNAGGLNHGAYSDTLTITNLTSGIVRSRSVELRVVGPTIELSQNEFYFQAEQGGNNPPNQKLGISNIGGGVLNWQISEACDWLSVNPTWGSSSISEVDDVNIIIDINGLTWGIYSCQLAVSDSNAENSPQIVTVTCWISSVSTVIYWTDNEAGKIQRAWLLSSDNIEDVVATGLQSPRNIAFDTSANKMYWTDSSTNKIQRANPDGSNIEDVVTGLSEPWGIALDINAGKMYWSEYGINRIQRANLDGSNIEELITGLTYSPDDIALDLSGGKMYWGGFELCRANLDSSNLEVLFITGMGWVNSIALDLFSGKIYWAFAGICWSNLDGSNVEWLVNNEWAQDITLDLPGGKMYWTDVMTGRIQRANLDGSNIEDMVTGLCSPFGIAISENIETTDDLSVTPLDRLNSEGYEGGPFTPASKTYTLHNTGPNSINWTASVTQDWLDVSTSSGTLGPNDVNTVRISINSNASGLNYGTYNNALIITNLTEGFVRQRSFLLKIRPKFKIAAPDGTPGDYFGCAVSVDGDRCIVGAYEEWGASTGSAYIFKWNGTNWIQEAKLKAPDGTAGDLFGVSVDIDGDRCIVGAYYDDDMGESSGSTYIFNWNGSSWIQQAKLTALDGTEGDYFGHSVGIDGNRCIVGAFGDIPMGIPSGSAYIFNWNGSSWVQQAKLTPSDGTAWIYFGRSVSISGNRCIAGAEGDALGSSGYLTGSAYIFNWNGSSWVQQAKLTASDYAEQDEFGCSVSISGDRCIVGAHLNDDMGNGSGSAYIFNWNGSRWIQKAKLTASDGAAYDLFGCSVSISGDRCIVGAYQDDDMGDSSGSAYLFEWNGTTWFQKEKLLAPDGSADDCFGYSVNINGDRSVVGAYEDDESGDRSGSAYVYKPYSLPDLDKNWIIDFNDFAIFASQWLQTPGVPSADIAPPEGDGFVDYEDLDVFCQYWLD